jgi:hypothetical protein
MPTKKKKSEVEELREEVKQLLAEQREELSEAINSVYALVLSHTHDAGGNVCQRVE